MMMRRTAAALIGALVAVPVLAGCAGSAGGDRPLQIAVGDGSLRAVDDDCAGTGAYRHVHAGVDLVLTNDDGDEVLRRTLGPGTAIAADDIDYEQTPRIPTICVFSLDAGDLAGDATYQVEIDGTAHGELLYLPDADGIPTILVPEANLKGQE